MNQILYRYQLHFVLTIVKTQAIDIDESSFIFRPPLLKVRVLSNFYIQIQNDSSRSLRDRLVLMEDDIRQGSESNTGLNNIKFSIIYRESFIFIMLMSLLVSVSILLIVLQRKRIKSEIDRDKKIEWTQSEDCLHHYYIMMMIRNQDIL